MWKREELKMLGICGSRAGVGIIMRSKNNPLYCMTNKRVGKGAIVSEHDINVFGIKLYLQLFPSTEWPLASRRSGNIHPEGGTGTGRGGTVNIPKPNLKFSAYDRIHNFSGQHR